MLLPMALPADAAVLTTPCAAGAPSSSSLLAPQSLGAPSVSPASASCAQGTGTGGVGRAPGEYLDPLTGIVYKDTGNGLVPAGVGALASYVQLNSLGGPTRLCDSSTPVVGCDTSPDCADLVCQDVYVAILGCAPVTLSYDLQEVDTNDVGDDDVPPPTSDAVPVTCGSSGGVTYSLVDTRITHGFSWADCDPGDQVTVTTLMQVGSAPPIAEKTEVMICGPASARHLPVAGAGGVS
jgi:hypothetical protein